MGAFRRLRVGYDEERGGSIEHAAQRETQGVGIESGKALIQYNDVSALKQRPGDVEPATLAVRELRAGLAD